MDAEMYTEILESTLLEFLQRVFPDGHRFQQTKSHGTPHKTMAGRKGGYLVADQTPPESLTVPP